MREVLNRKHVAIILACSETTVDDLVRRGLLRYTHRWPGGHRCFLWEHVAEYKAYLLAESRGGERARAAILRSLKEPARLAPLR